MNTIETWFHWQGMHIETRQRAHGLASAWGLFFRLLGEAMRNWPQCTECSALMKPTQHCAMPYACTRCDMADPIEQ